MKQIFLIISSLIILLGIKIADSSNEPTGIKWIIFNMHLLTIFILAEIRAKKK